MQRIMKINKQLNLCYLTGIAATVFLFTKLTEKKFTINDPYSINYPDQRNFSPIWSNSLGETDLFVGIPTVKRAAESYLRDTLTSIKNDLRTFKDSETFKISIVLFVGKSDKNYFDELVEEYQDDLSDDFAILMAPDDYYHKYLVKPISPTFGDSMERMFWRTMQALDYIFLWESAIDFPLYLQLEDDVLVSPGFFHFISGHLKSLENRRDWFSLEFSPLGFIGKMFNKESLQALTQYSKLFFDVKPIDWIYWSYIRMKVCSPEWDKDRCERELRKIVIPCSSRIPLLRHIGSISSLDGKVQNLVDRPQGNPEVSKLRCTDNIDLSELKAIYYSSKTIKVFSMKDKKTTIEISFRHLQSPEKLIFYHGSSQKLPGELSNQSKSKIPYTTKIYADIYGEGWKHVLDFFQCNHGSKTTTLGVKTSCSMNKLSSEKTIIKAIKIEVSSDHEPFLLHKIDIFRS
ncbi:Oidioi.mRNA.OKI2018_I69.chr1.g1495.t1.cds [Oikopleura dioica]|uniref:Oidioi.mRNA.OKI2018_I69.chr1.g1495.t1.cds n=1 Tax=Oikopleura dioica TaxID=34765 RepID=A0ABN7ST62_OIKDI|nr:Oidioi.mRNA.OKI2018_I69.chr1.g1495.t1.cds [Oikopleura dioica]